MLPNVLALALNSRRQAPRRTDAPGSVQHYVRGRYALAEAYRLAGLQPGHALLAPAYHCVTMLDPALACGATVHLYPLLPDLSPDLSALSRMMDAIGTPARVLLATHFFGFPRDFSALREWCRERQISLVEDCSHALLTERWQASGIGEQGDFVVSSPYKFFPSDDGGLLHVHAADRLPLVVTTPPKPIDELRGIKHVLEKRTSDSLTDRDITLLDRQLSKLSASVLSTGNDEMISRAGPSKFYAAHETGRAALRSSRFLVRHARLDEAISQRQSNYEIWVKAAVNFVNSRPLYPDRPPDCVPYMFPLYIDHPIPHFFWLKHLGVPVWRWDEMAVSECPVAADYRLHLLHLPCHQSLSRAQMSWMIAAVDRTLRLPPTYRRS